MGIGGGVGAGWRLGLMVHVLFFGWSTMDVGIESVMVYLLTMGWVSGLVNGVNVYVVKVYVVKWICRPVGS